MNLKIQKLPIKDYQYIKSFMEPIWYSAYSYLDKEHVDILINKFFEINNLKKQIEKGIIYEEILLDNELVGLCAYFYKEDYLYLDKLYLKEEAQNKNISSFVINYLDDLAEKIRLVVDKLNVQAIKAYQKNDFKIIGEELTTLENGSINEDYIMERQTSFIINKTKEFVKNLLKDDRSGHDYLHVERVYKTSLKILQEEKANKLILSLTALLHDVDDYKLFKESKNAENFLKSLDLEEDKINQVLKNIEEISFKGKDSLIPTSIEGKIVQDADRLDAMGAIGIARCFTYGGYKKHKMYDKNIKPIVNLTKEEYYNHESTSINHFYEKLFLLKDLMNTEYGKKEALKRHQILVDFVNEFNNEVGEESEN